MAGTIIIVSLLAYISWMIYEVRHAPTINDDKKACPQSDHSGPKETKK